MIEINGRKYLNLEEAVHWAVQNIKKIYETSEILGKFGIKIVGNVASEEDLMNQYPPDQYDGEYGDAILVGTSTPYKYYIFTRPFDGDISQWFNIGEFPLPGPTGATGQTGATGPSGTRGNVWFTGIGSPSDTLDSIDGDLYLDTNTNNVYKYIQGSWAVIATIKGERGENGQTGPAGPTGPVVDIIGKLGNVDQLPTIQQALELYGRQAAYLIPKGGIEGEQLEVWGMIGPDEGLTWSNLGTFSSGTVVYYQGSPINSLNIDNYIRKINTPTTNTRYVYTVYNNVVSLRKVTASTFEADTFPWRTTNGQINVPALPDSPNNAVSRAFVESQISTYHNKTVITYGSGEIDPFYNAFELKPNKSFSIFLDYAAGSSITIAAGNHTLFSGGSARCSMLKVDTFSYGTNLGMIYHLEYQDGTRGPTTLTYIPGSSALSIDVNGPCGYTYVGSQL